MVVSKECLVMRAGGDKGDAKALEGSVQFGVSDNGIVQDEMHWSLTSS